MSISVAIIGGGPAGIACAIQLKRYGIEPLLFEKKEIGGLMKNALWIENYLGFPQGVSPQTLKELFLSHLENYRIEVRLEEAIELEYREGEKNFSLRTSRGNYFFSIVVIASGSRALAFPFSERPSPSLDPYIHYEIHPILLEKKKTMVVLGAGDIAFDYALNLSRNNQVWLFNRGTRIKALPLLQERIQREKNISYRDSTSLEKVQRGSLYPLKLTFRKREEIFEMEADYLAMAIGREAQKHFYAPSLFARESALVQNKILYLCGDVKNEQYRQIAIASGSGIQTAMEIHEKLQEKI